MVGGGVLVGVVIGVVAVEFGSIATASRFVTGRGIAVLLGLWIYIYLGVGTT
ncbi:hypothetical protein B0T18DRAFT_423009 [Schizothecium vesticola]|uniref:Uncharacterized protein n=1 Tax=Schizothecium vesticola TaxID=314040 RepID=A0AA40BRA9_9PEZI|nr:hypothetical protein B0T18DRAFT_423009 [Schizothecium vesticola]